MEIHVTAVEKAGREEFAEGLRFPRRLRVRAEGGDLPYNIKAVIEIAEGRLVARSLTATQRDGGPPVTSEGLRRVPVGHLVRQAAYAVVGYDPDLGVPALTELMLGPAVMRARSQGPTDETLRLVAAVYRLAYVMGDPPTQVVGAWFGIPRSTAGRWVATARRRGSLGPAEPRKAGV